MNKIGIQSWFGYPVTMEECLKLIKATGFDAVMLWWGEENAAIDVDKLYQPEMARKNGLFIESIHTPFEGVNCLWTEGIDGDDFEKNLSNCIEDCSKYDIPAAVVHVSKGNNPPPMNQIGLDRFKRLVETAERNNVNIAIENTRRLDYLDFIFSNIKSDRLGFCYDSGHENCFTKGTDLLTKYGSRLMTCHLHDNDGTDDQHQIPGEGNIDWKDISQKFKSSGYKGTFSLEVTNEFSEYKGKETLEEFLERAYNAVKCL